LPYGVFLRLKITLKLFLNKVLTTVTSCAIIYKLSRTETNEQLTAGRKSSTSIALDELLN
jgi:hypothetical protein